MVFGVYKKKKYVSKRKYKLSVCGHFGGNNNFCDGQTVKTKNIYQALCEYYGEEKINKIDTYNWKKHPISFLYECINGMKNSQNMIILPAQNGVKVFVPLFLIINKFYKRKNILCSNRWMATRINKEQASFNTKVKDVK